ncbi:MAG TPA: hypothetical protein PLS66_04525 [Tepiditoga sp.]|nr:hypothetical protein [Tepiditoga sp.]
MDLTEKTENFLIKESEEFKEIVFVNDVFIEYDFAKVYWEDTSKMGSILYIAFFRNENKKPKGIGYTYIDEVTKKEDVKIFTEDYSRFIQNIMMPEKAEIKGKKIILEYKDKKIVIRKEKV